MPADLSKIKDEPRKGFVAENGSKKRPVKKTKRRKRWGAHRCGIRSPWPFATAVH